MALAFHPQGGYLYVANAEGKELISYRLDGVSGKLTELGKIPLSLVPNKLVSEPSGQYLYGLVEKHKQLLRFALDGKTGLVKPLQAVELDYVPHALSISASVH